MKILMIGRGVISTQYAWAFEKAGHTVEFYVRKGRKEEYGPTVSLNMYDARKGIRGKLIKDVWPIKMTEEIDIKKDYDLIIVCVQHYQFQKVSDLLSDKIGNATVLIANNFWDEPLEQVTSLPSNQIVWGFPQAGGGFNANGTLEGSLFGGFIIGTFGTELSDRALEVINLYKSAGIKCKTTKDFRSWLFGHFILNAAMHIETIKIEDNLSILNTIQKTEHWKNVLANGKELLILFEARNADVTSSPDLKIFRLPPWLLATMMKLIIKFVPSIKQIFTGHSNIQETKSYSQAVLTTAELMQIPLPRYEQNRKSYE